MRVIAPPPVAAPACEPTFSIVIPAYQAADTIGDALRSVLEQSPPPHEVIVCDDGSTDDLHRALAPWRERIRLVRKENGGGASALNAARRAATGEFVAICDADDAYRPGRLAALARLARERPDLDLLSTDADFERGGEVIGRFGATTPFPAERQRERILEACWIFAPAIRRARLETLGGFDEALRIAYDWDMWIRLILDGARAGSVDEPLMRYRLRPGSLSDVRLDSLRERVTVLDKTAFSPALRPAERGVLNRSRDRAAARVRLAEAQAAVRNGSPDRRRRLVRLAVDRAQPLTIRRQAARRIVGFGGFGADALDRGPVT